jgi:hypothetical protein
MSESIFVRATSNITNTPLSVNVDIIEGIERDNANTITIINIINDGRSYHCSEPIEVILDRVDEALGVARILRARKAKVIKKISRQDLLDFED